MGNKFSIVKTTHTIPKNEQNNEKESYVLPPINSRANVCDNEFLNCYSKGVHGIQSLKHIEETKQTEKNQEKNKQTEKFKGFAYKNNSPEPFERSYVCY